MTHIELENLTSDYVEGLLSAARKAEVEAHLVDCAYCRELVSDVRGIMELCRSAENLEPAPWVVSKTLLATLGERKPTLKDRLVALIRPPAQPRIGYAVAMAVFSFSIVVNAAGLNLRHLTFERLNPFTLARRAYSTGQLLYARGEKFYYDLRVVYEIESRFRRLRAEPQGEDKEAPKQESPSGGSSDRKQSGDPQWASIESLIKAGPAEVMAGAGGIAQSPGQFAGGRSSTQ